MDSISERFLGYFRTIEYLISAEKLYFDVDDLCKTLEECENIFIKNEIGKKSDVTKFIKRIKYLNSQKNSIESSINSLLKEIKRYADDFNFKSLQIKELVDSRNDLIHANDVYHSDEELDIYCIT